MLQLTKRISTLTALSKFPDKRVKGIYADVWENRLPFLSKTIYNFSEIDILQPTPSMSVFVPSFSVWLGLFSGWWKCFVSRPVFLDRKSHQRFYAAIKAFWFTTDNFTLYNFLTTQYQNCKKKERKKKNWARCKAIISYFRDLTYILKFYLKWYKHVSN